MIAAVMTFREKLEKRIAATGSNLCVGLDVRMEEANEATKRFIIKVIEETAPHAAAFKPNSAYYEAMGWKGMRILSQVLKEIPKEIPVIFDVKRGDIGETQAYYAKSAYDAYGVDAVTLNGYMGSDTLEPFLKYPDKGIYLLGVTSNPGAKDVELQPTGGNRKVFELVADMTKVSKEVGLVIGLTNAEENVLARTPDVPLLIPGLGAQGGDLSALKGSGRQAPILVNVSRGIMYHQERCSYSLMAADWKLRIQEALR
ncbi:MAG TPA: orotidine-5'-phosphate decarboxylase [Prosthecobacter sp.]